jgi:hypothetical protein
MVGQTTPCCNLSSLMELQFFLEKLQVVTCNCKESVNKLYHYYG